MASIPSRARRAGGFDTICVELAGAGSEANRAALLQHSPTGKVPALDDHELGVTIWDSLAICEHIAECHPSAGVWPSDPSARAIARAVVMEMHSGFSALRLSDADEREKALPAHDLRTRGPA